jgi:prepilin peptidase CpaA
MLSLLALGIFLTALVAAAATDITRYEIPNGASIALVAGFALAAPALSFGDIAWHIAAGGVMFVVTALLFVRGLMGGGDVKAATGLALWYGLAGLPALLLLISMLGGGLAIALLAARRLAPQAADSGSWYARLLSKKEGVPYGVAISGAGLVLAPQLFAFAPAQQALLQAFGG